MRSSLTAFVAVMLAAGFANAKAPDAAPPSADVPLPNFNTAVYCANHGPTCPDLEAAAKQQLPGVWAGAPRDLKASCVQKGKAAGPGGSYEVTLWCISKKAQTLTASPGVAPHPRRGA